MNEQNTKLVQARALINNDKMDTAAEISCLWYAVLVEGLQKDSQRLSKGILVLCAGCQSQLDLIVLVPCDGWACG